MKGLKVKDVMTRGVLTIPQDASVREAVEMLADNDISGLAVTSAEGELIGVLSETDMVRVVSENMEGEDDLYRIRVSEVMAAPAITVNREDDLKEACRIMYRNNIHRLIVQQEVKRGDHVKYFPGGILSISDVIKVLSGRKLHG
ncbi:MAG: CBS domain-containing protein [Nitrospirota bacterium]